jgi:hypothetical protein
MDQAPVSVRERGQLRWPPFEARICKYSNPAKDVNRAARCVSITASKSGRAITSVYEPPRFAIVPLAHCSRRSTPGVLLFDSETVAVLSTAPPPQWVIVLRPMRGGQDRRH